MPIGEIETHPYLEQGQINGSTKLFLGSFPVYECTNPDNQIKQQNRQNEGTVRFFYGSVDSGLWGLYRDNIDTQIVLPINPDIIIQSLAQNKIAVSDTIYSCQRHEFSSSDNELIRKNYNRKGIQKLIKNGVRKIICTSKGVMKDLEKQIISSRKDPIGKLDKLASYAFQDSFISEIGGNIDQIKTPISKVFLVEDYQITALAIPSPGSPQRKLADFGFNDIDWRNYADNYFTNAFNWLNE
ncbi:MAG: hypothetical protein ACON4M_05060 [Crocinitomicaceae bacterium]